MTAPRPDHRARLLALEQTGIKLGLDQIRALLRLLGRPDLAFPALTVAGTNGKGSVAAMLDRGLRAAGWRTGRYTSPHLVNLEERVTIDGRPLAPAAFDRLAASVLEAASALPFPPSFFEATTALALEAFRQAPVTVAVLEVGLGGRLDATNAVDSVGVAITAIDFDHEQYLGDTIAAIAREKAGVIKPGSIVVLGPNREEVDVVVADACRSAGAGLTRAHEGVAAEVTMRDGQAALTLTTPVRHYESLHLSLRGRHQVENAITAIRLLEAIDRRGVLAIPTDAIRAAVEDVTWPGRLELLQTAAGDVLIDGAHNPAGARVLGAYVGETYGHPVPFVVGTMRDKKVSGILKALGSVASEFVCTSTGSPRAMSARELLAAAASAVPAVPAVAVEDPIHAVHYAAARGRPVVVAGSLYLAGAVRAAFSS